MKNFECLLGESYQYNVHVAFTPNIFHLGTLNMSPNEITIQFSCEYNRADNEEKFHWDYKEVCCQTSGLYFKLIDLEVVNYEDGVFSDSMYERRYYRAVYSVQYVIISETPFSSNEWITGFSIVSEDINKWIGNTNKQEAILSHYGFPLSNSIEQTEFHLVLSPDYSLACGYDINIFHNSPEYKGGISFPPKTMISYYQQVDFKRIKSDLNWLIDIFSFLIGKEIIIEKLLFIYSQPYNKQKKVQVYFRHDKKNNQSEERQLVFFPLGTDLRFRTEDVPEFHLNTFKTFYGLNDFNRGLIKQLLKARTMLIGEDKYLSTFRVAEKLSYKKGHKTTDNLIRAFEKIENISPSIIDNVEKMVRLRHDISHANEYTIDESTLYFYIGAVDVLATYLIIKKLLIIDDQIIAKILPRHRQLRSMVVPKIYYSENIQKENESNNSDSLK